MPKSSNQKLKLLYLLKILREETDEEHFLNSQQLIELPCPVGYQRGTEKYL